MNSNEVLNWRSIRERVISLYKGGSSTREIGRMFNVSHVTVNTKLDMWGVPRRNGKCRRNLRLKDLTGKRYGKLKVLGRDSEHYPPRWRVRCDCGQESSMQLKQLIKAKSCGCMRGRRKSKLRLAHHKESML